MLHVMNSSDPQNYPVGQVLLSSTPCYRTLKHRDIYKQPKVTQPAGNGEPRFEPRCLAPEPTHLLLWNSASTPMLGTWQGSRGAMELGLTQYFPNFLARGTFLRAAFTSIISAFMAHGGGSTGPRRHHGIW